MKVTLPTIYPITDRRLSGLSHLEQVRRLFSGGAKFIQLREKSGSSGDFLDAAVEAVEFARVHDVSIIINDRVDIALATKAAGVHLGQDDMPPDKARALLGDEKIIGISTHTVKQAQRAATLPIDYIAFGPIYPTQTKDDPETVVGLEGIRQVRDVIADIPLVAIGGIGLDQIAEVLSAGATSVVMISSIVGDPANISEKVCDLTKRFTH